MTLGSVDVVLSTARLDALDRWAQRLAFAVFAIWLVVLVQSIGVRAQVRVADLHDDGVHAQGGRRRRSPNG